MVDLSPRLINGVKSFEGYRATPYWDYKQYTSGYGTKASSPFETVDRQTAESRLQDELAKAARTVDNNFPNLKPGTRDALTSLTYNAGPGWMSGGLGNAIRSGNMDQARQIFGQYNHAGGQVNPGLVNRRQAELGWWNGQPPRPPADIPPQPGIPPGAMAQGGLLGGLPQGAPQQSPMPQYAQAAPQGPPAQGMPQAAGQAPGPSIFDMIRNALPSAPNLPLFAGGQGAAPQQGQVDPALAAWFNRQNTFGG